MCSYIHLSTDEIAKFSRCATNETDDQWQSMLIDINLLIDWYWKSMGNRWGERLWLSIVIDLQYLSTDCHWSAIDWHWFPSMDIYTHLMDFDSHRIFLLIWFVTGNINRLTDIDWQWLKSTIDYNRLHTPSKRDGEVVVIRPEIQFIRTSKTATMLLALYWLFVR